MRDRPGRTTRPGAAPLDAEQMVRRDTQVAKLLAAHVPFRTIASRLNMNLRSVQQAHRRPKMALIRNS